MTAALDVAFSLIAWALLIAAGVVVAMMLAGCAPAYAQAPSRCFPEAQLVAQLAARHGEAEIWSGRDARSGNELVLFAAPGGGSWTALIRQRGMLCAAFSGASWKLPAAVGTPA